MFKKNISHKEILIAIVIYLISVPLVFQLLENQYISLGFIKGGVEGFTKIKPKSLRKCNKNCNVKYMTSYGAKQPYYKDCKRECRQKYK